MLKQRTRQNKDRKEIKAGQGKSPPSLKTEQAPFKAKGPESALPEKPSLPSPARSKPPSAGSGVSSSTRKSEQLFRPKTEPAGPKTESRPKKEFLDDYELPSAYNTTSLTLIARDPHWIYAYWEIGPSSIEEIRAKIGDAELRRSSYTLRMYDVTCIDFNGSNANHWFDIDVGPCTNNWYINLWNDNLSYCGEIGIRTAEGRFFALARSNFVTTPRQGSSGRSELIWMEVKEDLSNSPYVIAESRPPGAAVSPPTQEVRGGAKSSRRKIFLSEEDVRAYYSRLFPLLRKIISARRRNGQGRTAFKYYLKEGEVLFEDFLIRDLSVNKFTKRIRLGSSEELILGGASELLKKPGASEREEKKRKFFFELGTELIVYGRTEPDAEVWLGGKKIKLRSDGTFSLRFALEDGKIPLDFSAQSRDKIEKRVISTEVERTKTKRSHN